MNVLLIGSHVRGSFFGGSHCNNLGLLSIASNLDPEHKVKVFDCFKKGETVNVKQIIDDFRPRVIGLSAMTFQYEGARNFAAEIRKRYRDIIIVLGGYHATAMYKETMKSGDGKLFDYVIRKEGEYAFNKLLQAIDGRCQFDEVPNLSYVRDGVPVHTESYESVNLDEIKLPDRRLIADNDYSSYVVILGTTDFVTCVETSRGCIHNCDFCSIKLMYTTPYRTYSLSRVIEDIKNIKQFQPQTKRIFFVDDNITADPKRFEELCDLIIENKLNTFKFSTQGSSVGLSSSETLVTKMKEAGFDFVFIGIENNSKTNLKYMGKGNILSRTETACKYLRKHGIKIVGALIFGWPDDDKESIKSAFKYLRKLGAHYPAAQFYTPFPKTVLREDYLKRKLIDNIDDYIYYDLGFCNIHTNHLSSRELYKTAVVEYLKHFLFLQRKGFIETLDLRTVFQKFTKLLKLHFLIYLVIYGPGDKIGNDLIKRKSDARKKSEASRFFEKPAGASC